MRQPGADLLGAIYWVPATGAGRWLPAIGFWAWSPAYRGLSHHSEPLVSIVSDTKTLVPGAAERSRCESGTKGWRFDARKHLAHPEGMSVAPFQPSKTL